MILHIRIYHSALNLRPAASEGFPAKVEPVKGIRGGQWFASGQRWWEIFISVCPFASHWASVTLLLLSACPSPPGAAQVCQIPSSSSNKKAARARGSLELSREFKLLWF